MSGGRKGLNPQLQLGNLRRAVDWVETSDFHGRADDGDQAKAARKISVDEDRNVMYVPARITPVEIEPRLSYRGSKYKETWL